MTKARFYLAQAIVLSLCLLCPAQEKTADETRIIEVINKYLAAQSQKDVFSMVTAWSHRSPDLAESFAEIEKSLAVEQHTFSNLRVSRMKITAGKAILQAAADQVTVDLKTGESRRRRYAKNFALLKEGGDWKIWRDAPEGEDLSTFLEKGREWKTARDAAMHMASELVAAKSDEEKSALLADNRELVNAHLLSALVERADELRHRASYKRAIEVYRMVRRVAALLNDERAVAMAESRSGDAYQLLGEGRTALASYEAALALFERLGEKIDAAETLSKMGTVHVIARDRKKALESYEKSLAIYEEMKDREGTAGALENIGSVHYDQEDYNLALQFYDKSLRLREALGGKREIAATISNIGNIYYQKEDYGQAVAYYERAIAGFTLLGDKMGAAGAMNNIGSAEFSQGNYDRALRRYQSALALAEESRASEDQATALRGMAAVYFAEGNYGPALANFQKNLALNESLRDNAGMAEALSDIGQTYRQLHLFERALESYQKSLKLYGQALADFDVAQTLAAIGGIHFAMATLSPGQGAPMYELALSNYEQSLAMFEAMKEARAAASLRSNVAGVHFAQGKKELALEGYRRSLAEFEALGNVSATAIVLERIAAVHLSKGELLMSVEAGDLSAARARSAANHDALWRARLTTGVARRALNEAAKAHEDLAESIATIESMRDELLRVEQAKQHFFGDKAIAYITMADLLIAQGKVVEALAVVERARAVTLRAALQNSRATIYTGMTARQQEEERKLENAVASLKGQIRREKKRRRPDERSLAALNGRLEGAWRDYRGFEKSLYSLNPRLKVLRVEADPLNIDEAAALLDSKTALLEFVVTESRAYLFALTKEPPGKSAAERRPTRGERFVNTLRSYALDADRGRLSDRVTLFRQAIERGEEVGQQSRELFDLLLKPAAEQLKGKAKILIVPDGPLWQLPFHALRAESGRHLIEDAAVAYAPSIAALCEAAKVAAPKPAAPATLLAVADPAVSAATVDRLKLVGEREPAPRPEGVEEVRALERLYAGRGRTLTGARATEEAVKAEAGKARIIHLAATARFNDASPMYSHLILSRDDQPGAEDGLLQLREVIRMALAADLVVFSAAEGAGGSGESMAALNWALFVAGCPSAIIGQWRTDARGAVEFVSELHRNPGGRPAEALRAAALKMLGSTEHRHPRHWAGFRALGYR